METKLFKAAGVLLFICLFLFVTGKLFFKEQTDDLINRLFFGDKAQNEISDQLVIGFSAEPTSLDPLSREVQNRDVLLQIYESLVKTDADLKIEPALAISYGAVDDLTWEFKLRPNVLFHDGSQMTADDAISSVNDANLPSVDKIEKIDAEKIRIATKKVDPLFLQEIAAVLIYPARAKEVIETKPIGTGPYQFESLKDDEIALRKWSDYWGDAPQFAKVVLKFLAGRGDRKKALSLNSVDLLTDVPPELLSEFYYENFEPVTHPTIEADFLLFGFRGPFRDKNLRKAALTAFDASEVARMAFGFAKPVNQFAGKGIYGYSPAVSQTEADPAAAAELVKKINKGIPIKISIDMPEGMRALAEFIGQKLKRVGFDPEISLNPPEKLEEKIFKGEADLYFFGWRYELGDVSSFLNEAVHSKEKGYGKFNNTGFRNSNVDHLIEESNSILSPLERLEKLRKAMEIITMDDPIGIPLFIPEALYAKHKDLKWESRIDGYVMAGEVESDQ